MADEYKLALSKTLHEGWRRILLLISWIVFLTLSIIIISNAVMALRDLGYSPPSILNEITIINKDGTSHRVEREWSLSNITKEREEILYVSFASLTGLCIAYGLSFFVLPSLTRYLWALFSWVVMGFKNKKG